jgi:hypothetical protein
MNNRPVMKQTNTKESFQIFIDTVTDVQSFAFGESKLNFHPLFRKAFSVVVSQKLAILPTI